MERLPTGSLKGGSRSPLREPIIANKELEEKLQEHKKIEKALQELRKSIALS